MFLSKPLFYMTKKSRQKLNILRMKQVKIVSDLKSAPLIKIMPLEYFWAFEF